MGIEIRKFVQWQTCDYEQILKTPIVSAMKDFENGNKLSLKSCHICSETGIVRIAGWEINFRDLMHEYWIKTKNFGIVSRFALSKSDVRMSLGNREIIRIVDVTIEK